MPMILLVDNEEPIPVMRFVARRLLFEYGAAVPVMRFVAHRFLFEYGAAATVADLEKSTHF